MKESKKILPFKPPKLGPSQFEAEVERLKAAGSFPTLEQLLPVIAEVRGEYRQKILDARKSKHGQRSSRST